MAMDPGDEPPFPPLAPASVSEISDEQVEKQAGLKQQSADALEDGDAELALEKLNEAISIGCPSALMYSRRAQILMQLGRPRAVINDCTAALKINPDSGKAFKIRGRAYARLEQWEEAHSDFTTGLKIDFDEQTEEDSREAAERVKAIQAAAVASRRRKEEEEYVKKLQASREAYEAGMRARQQEASGAGGGKTVLSCAAEYEAVTKENRPVVVLFSATW